MRQRVTPGVVVVLNGTSSSGKTSVAKAFQELQSAAKACWVITGIDDFMPKLPGPWVDVPGWPGPLADDGVRLVVDGDRARFQLGWMGQALLRAYRRSVRELAHAGVAVIVDEVLLDELAWTDWCEVLDGLDVTWVAVRCDVDVAIARERARGDRPVGLARDQAATVHTFAAYDLEVDTSHTTAEEAARHLLDLLTQREARAPR